MAQWSKAQVALAEDPCFSAPTCSSQPLVTSGPLGIKHTSISHAHAVSHPYTSNKDKVLKVQYVLRCIIWQIHVKVVWIGEFF